MRNSLLLFRQPRFLVRAIVDQPVLPLAGIPFLAHRRIERNIASQEAAGYHPRGEVP